MYPFFYCSHHRRDYKSEYKQRFRPFSQYEYLDGRFVTNANGNGNGQVTPPVTASKIKEQLALQPKATSLHGEPWYREVVELRKQANDYKVCIPYLWEFCRSPLDRIVLWGIRIVKNEDDCYPKEINPIFTSSL